MTGQSENRPLIWPGVFVAGDNRTKELRQLVTAADGAVAATEAVKYLNG